MMLIAGLALAGDPNEVEGVEEPAEVASEAPAAFDQYELVVLRRGPQWTAEVTDEVKALQAEHMGYLRAMGEAGHLVVAGPLSDPPDPALRGICLYRTGSLDEARALAEADPAVQAGRLQVEVMSWWTEKDALSFPRIDAQRMAGTHKVGGAGHGHGGHHAHGHHGHDGRSDGATVHHRFKDADRWAAVFDDPERDAWQRPDDLVKALDIGKGSTVADVGAGTGYLLPHLAKAVGKKGTVLAIDVEPELVLYMAKRILSQRLMQVEPRLGGFDHPGLRPGEADMILLLDTYHHIDARVDYFRRLREAVRPGGRLVVVDFKPDEDLPVGPPPDHRIAPEQVEAELGEAGWTLVDAPEVLPYQFVQVYTLAQ